MEYSGANSVFIRILLDKKYALPYRVVDTLVTHFCSFTHADKRLPVLWHQALLVFIQRYDAPSLFSLTLPLITTLFLSFCWITYLSQIQGGDDATTKGRDKEVGESAATYRHHPRNTSRTAALEVARRCRHDAGRGQASIQSLRARRPSKVNLGRG